MAAVHLGEESETDRGWCYRTEILWTSGTPTRHVLTLSWADHDHWTGGKIPPSALAEVVLGAAAEALGRDALPDHFDASTISRRIPGLADRLSRLA